MKNMLLEKIENRSAKIGILGLGYVGLPNLVNHVEKGYHVTGYDVDLNKVENINNKKSYIEDISSELLEKNKDKFHATNDFNSLKGMDIIFIDVPTPILLDKTPDYKYVQVACEDVINNSRKGQLIILESTVSPGTTYKYLVKKLSNKGYVVGEDIFVGYSPERIDPGNKKFNFSEIIRIVSGYSDNCLELMEALFEDKSHPVSKLEVAELTKLYENAFRFINIAFADEVSKLTEKMGVSFDEVVNAADSKQYGFMKFTPSYKIGGHCIPVDPFYMLDYAYSLGVSLNTIVEAGNINDSMIYGLIRKIDDYIEESGKIDIKIALIGASYKANIKDPRMAVANELSDRLIEKEIVFDIFDNLDESMKIGRFKRSINKIDYDKINKYDLAVILQEHDYIDFNKIDIDKIYATRF